MKHQHDKQSMLAFASDIHFTLLGLGLYYKHRLA